MASGDEDEQTLYSVVVNHEEQYSIWPSAKPLPPGWRAVGMEAGKAECLRYIDEIWTDMRPLSLRRKMGAEEEGDAQTDGKKGRDS